MGMAESMTKGDMDEDSRVGIVSHLTARAMWGQ